MVFLRLASDYKITLPMVQLSRCSGMYYSGYGGVSQEQHLQKYLDALTRVTSIHYAILMNNETRELPALTTGYFPDTMSLCFILYHFILDRARSRTCCAGKLSMLH